MTIDENPKNNELLGFKITEKENKLPVLYWMIPKMLKNPLGTRFIIAAKISSTIFLNLVLMCLSSYTPKLNIFIKM